MPEGMSEAQMVERILRLEDAVRQICDRLGIVYDDGSAGVSPEVLALARSGDRMRAAKLHAEQTGCDFVSAQKVVNAL